MERTWTITELAERATATLTAGPTVPGDQVNGRVRDMPNERLIRWYTTIGLVDPPLGRRGRIALYGRRHLLQLVAVKRRQAAGLTIAEIQVELAGAPDDILREIARLPDLVPEPDTDPNTDPVVAHRDRFWAAPPAITVPIPLPAQTARPTRSQPVEGGPVAPPAMVHGVRLAEGVTLLFDGGAAPGAEDLAALAAAARPVLDELHRRGLLAVSPAVSPVLDGPPVHDLRPGSSP